MAQNSSRRETGAEQVQRQIAEAVEEVRLRIQEALDQAQERAEAAAELAVKLAYASIGVLDLVQEELGGRARRTGA